MKKTLLRNSIIVGTLLILSIPCNYFVSYYGLRLSILQYVPVIIFALLCGASLILMDLSNRRINAVFAVFYLIISLEELHWGTLFLYGPTAYFYVLMFGTLLTSIFRRKQDFEEKNKLKEVYKNVDS